VRTDAPNHAISKDGAIASDPLARAIFDGARDAMFLVDVDGLVLEGNAGAAELLGCCRAELIGKRIPEIVVHATDEPGAWARLIEDRALLGSTPIMCDDGARRSVEITATPNVRDGIHLVVLRDVTDRDLARARFVAIFGAAPIAITLTRVADRRYVEVNQTFLETMGYSRDEIVGRSAYEIDPWADPSARERISAALVTGGAVRDLETSVRTRSGELVRVLLNAEIVTVHGEACLLVFGTDITQWKRAEARYRALFDSNMLGVIAWNQARGIVEVNDAVVHMLGYTRAQYEPLIAEWGGLAPNLGVQGLAEMAATGRAVPFEKELLRADGKPLPVLIAAAALERGGHEGVGLLVDLSERRQAEQARRDLEDQLNHAQKMDAIGRLAGGIAHDLNNMLAAILGFASVMRADLPDDDPMQDDLEQIVKASDRAAALTRQLLAFGRKQMMQPQVLDLNELIDNLRKMLGRIIGEDIDLVVRQGDGLGSVKADPGQLEQVLVNLVVNARDAMPKGGVLTVETSSALLDEGQARRMLGVKPGRYVLVMVKDSGHGMDARTRERIFEPFFTTKEQGKGTGLGLATAYGIVTQSGGHITVESRIGSGTTFWIYLPVTEEAATSGRPSVGPPRTLRGTETVLVVEDEDLVRALAGELLRRHGYSVIEARGGAEALTLCEQHGRIDIVLTDVVMPKMGGRELVDRIRALYPSVRAVFMSGYAEGAVTDPSLFEAGATLVHKPFSPESLIGALRRALDEN